MWEGCGRAKGGRYGDGKEVLASVRRLIVQIGGGGESSK